MALTGEQDLDRSEAASPHKLAEARKRGKVAKSADLVSAIVLSVASAIFFAKGWPTLVDLFRLDQQLLVMAGLGVSDQASAAWLWSVLAHSLERALGLLLPMLALIMAAGVVANVVQTGPVLSLHPITPDWDRLNPMTGIRRILSMRTLFDAARSCIKLVVLTWVLASAVWALVPQFAQLSTLTPLGLATALISDMATLGVKMSIALCAIAVLDLIYTRREYGKNMMMSRREVRDEFKHREGDPRIRSRLRELRREMLKRSLSLRNTSQADVLITNPTHVAVALRYRHGEMNAPQLLSKGSGALAAAMRAIAARHHIPIIRSPKLARALHAGTPIDAHIPVELYAEVARLMVWLASMRRAEQVTANRVEAAA